MPQREIFKKIIIMHATKEASPELRADSSSLPAINSPSIAPTKIPRIIPKGGKNTIPTIIPIIDPQIPYFDAP